MYISDNKQKRLFYVFLCQYAYLIHMQDTVSSIITITIPKESGTVLFLLHFRSSKSDFPSLP